MTKRASKVKSTAIWILCLMCLLACLTALYLPAGEKSEKKTAYIGMEFGAMHTRVATFRDGEIDILPPEKTSQFSPSYIAFTDKGILFGEAAKLQAGINPRNTVFGIRRLIGRSFSDTETEIEHLPFKVISKANRPVIEIDLARGKKHYTPEQLFGLILGKTKETTEAYLEAEVSMAVFTVPNSFDDKQRQATKSAAELAGLDVSRLINESTAAGIAHKLDLGDDETHYLVYGLDDDTPSISLVQVDTGVFEIIAYTNDTAITSDVRHVEAKTLTLLDGLRRIEDELSGMENLDAFNSLKAASTTDEIFQRSLPSLEKILKSSKLTKEDIHDLVLVGISSHIPSLQPLLEEYLGVKASQVVEPANAHVVGATIQARVLSSDDVLYSYPTLSICPLSLGIETTGGIMTKIIPRHSILPLRRRKIFTVAANTQTTVVIKVYQGERLLTRDNTLLGEFELNLSPRNRGVPAIEVAFDLDDNYTLRVTARDLKVEKQETIVTQINVGWGDAEMLDFLLLQAESLHEQDDVLRQLLQITNAIDGPESMSG
ncbi:heat shock protein 70 family [Thelonectria olida]|uniref:non-chaperonin molecular chaperone ATPase n=1 Tax=Thelonectria olida TaxID=1576542 RepID=A0A9P8VP31_9HYPO|nr:heat shock protein 70 family [Thelonectria olida]